MAVSINDVKLGVELLAAKDQKTTYLNASKFNRYAPLAQDIVYRNKRRQFESSSVSSDELSELKQLSAINVPITGQMPKPSDYSYWSSVYKTGFFTDRRGNQVPLVNGVDLVTDSELGERLSSQFSPPTVQHPIVVEYDTYFQFYPENVGSVKLAYLRTPLVPFWNYTVSSNQQVYAATGGVGTNPNSGVTAGNSTDFELAEELKSDLIFTICGLLGITVRQADLFQSAQAINPQ